MSDLLDTLRQLQAVDTQLYRLRAEQRAKPLELEAVREQMAQQQAEAKESEARLKALQMQQKQKEMDLAGKDSSIKKLQMQLPQVKTNKEYSAIQREVDRAKADVSLLEEEILKAMDGIEQAAREHKARLGQAAQLQAALQQDEVRIAQDVAGLQERAAVLEAQRSALTPSIEPKSLTTYQRILVRREGLAMVPLMGHSCGGCNMVQPPQVVSEVHLKARLTPCESCNRILYVDESAVTSDGG